MTHAWNPRTQPDHKEVCEFKANVIYIVHFTTTYSTQLNPKEEKKEEGRKEGRREAGGEERGGVGLKKGNNETIISVHMLL